MRLQQAQAILATGSAVVALGLGFEMYPYDSECDGATRDAEYLTGFTEITDPDRPGNYARAYHLDLLPGPGEREISVHLSEGYGGDVPILLCQSFDVSAPDETGESFREGVAEEIAALAGATVRVSEVPYEAEYQERRRLGFNRFTPERWNELYEVGVPVVVYPGCRPEIDPEARSIRTRTRSAAWLANGTTPAVMVEDYSSWIALTHVDLATGGGR